MVWAALGMWEASCFPYGMGCKGYVVDHGPMGLPCGMGCVGINTCMSSCLQRHSAVTFAVLYKRISTSTDLQQMSLAGLVGMCWTKQFEQHLLNRTNGCASLLDQATGKVSASSAPNHRSVAASLNKSGSKLGGTCVPNSEIG